LSNFGGKHPACRRGGGREYKTQLYLIMPGIRGEKKTNVPLERGNKGKVSAYVYISNLPTVKNELGSKNNVIKVRIYFKVLINISYSIFSDFSHPVPNC
jgi:hypothetical protein